MSVYYQLCCFGYSNYVAPKYYNGVEDDWAQISQVTSYVSGNKLYNCHLMLRLNFIEDMSELLRHIAIG